MKSNLKKILRNVFFSSLGTLGTTQATEATTKENYNSLNNNDVQLEENHKNDLTQKFILKFGGDGSYLIAGHRSHRSHSSHRSHYSSSSGGGSSSSRSNNSYRNSSSSSKGTSGYSLPAQSKVYKLGDRILKRGMKGHDVTELLNILISKKYIIPEEDTDPVATGEFEFTLLIEEAVKNFQKDCSLTSDGIVGSSTVHHLKKKDD